jgi:membrane protein insertase Oxa1/YidC/SpoIIIJ
MLVNALTVDAQQRSTMIIMALVFGAFTASFSAGLSLFILVGTVLGVVQAKCIKALS